MKFAIVYGFKTEALKGVKGICPNWASELIAKCGEFKINHWAHKGVRLLTV
jgi:competence protein CoiA